MQYIEYKNLLKNFFKFSLLLIFAVFLFSFSVVHAADWHYVWYLGTQSGTSGSFSSETLCQQDAESHGYTSTDPCYSANTQLKYENITGISVDIVATGLTSGTQYQVVISDSEDNTKDIKFTATSTARARSTFPVLVPDTVYTAQLIEVSTSDVLNEITFKTPLLDFGGITFNNITQTSVEISPTHPPTGKNTFNFKIESLNLRDLDHPEEYVRTVTMNLNDNFVLIDDLEPGINYQVTARLPVFDWSGEVVEPRLTNNIGTFTTLPSAQLVSISITKPASKINYIIGDSLDISGLEVRAIYSDFTNSIVNITNSNITGFDSSKVATGQVLTITYPAGASGKTATYQVNIKKGTPFGGLVPCADKCNFDSLLTLVNNFVHFILFYMAVPISAIMFAYAGFMLMTAGGEAGKRTKAKGIFMNVAIGLALVAGAWLIIHTLLDILGYKQSWVTWFGF